MKRKPKTFSVATGHPKTTEAAAEILRAGGNAFDAAVAAGFASYVAEPMLTSPGGGGFLLAHTSKGEDVLYDFFVDTPGLASKRADLQPHFFPITVRFPGKDQVFYTGPGSVATPGVLKGLLHVHERLGRLPLKTVVEPAVRFARHGVPLTGFQAYTFELLSPILVQNEVGKKLFAPGGKPLTEGSVSRNPDYASYLEELPKEKGRDFYEGELARKMVRELEAEQSLLTETDLTSFQVKEREPADFRYRGATVLTNPSPSFGGSLILLTLMLLQEKDFTKCKWGSPDHLRALAVVLDSVDRLRAEDVINIDQLSEDERKRCKEKLRTSSGGTTHLSVADGDGNVASMTVSNGQGSGYIVPGTGIMLNNMLGEDDLHPQGFHSAIPGVRVSSMMAPTNILKDGKVLLTLGSGGSKRIRTAILQVMSNFIDFDCSVQNAVSAPRVHFDDGVLQVEPGYTEEAIERLEKEWKLNLWKEKNLYFGGVHAVVPGEGGAGDERRSGDDLYDTLGQK